MSLLVYSLEYEFKVSPSCEDYFAVFVLTKSLLFEEVHLVFIKFCSEKV